MDPPARSRARWALLAIFASATTACTTWTPMPGLYPTAPDADRFRVTTLAQPDPVESDSIEIRGDTLIVWKALPASRRSQPRGEQLQVLEPDLVLLEQRLPGKRTLARKGERVRLVWAPSSDPTAVGTVPSPMEGTYAGVRNDSLFIAPLTDAGAEQGLALERLWQGRATVSYHRWGREGSAFVIATIASASLGFLLGYCFNISIFGEDTECPKNTGAGAIGAALFGGIPALAGLAAFGSRPWQEALLPVMSR